MARRRHPDKMPPDLTLFAALATAWAAMLFVRVTTPFGFEYFGDPMQAVLAGVTFRGAQARGVTIIHALVVATFAAGMLSHKRWGAILALLYLAEAILSHLVFIIMNLDVRSEATNVRMAAFEGPTLVLILLYLWIRSQDFLFGSQHHS